MTRRALALAKISDFRVACGQNEASVFRDGIHLTYVKDGRTLFPPYCRDEWGMKIMTLTARSDRASRRTNLQADDLVAMSTNQLWTLHQELTAELCQKIAARKIKLEERLRRLDPAAGSLVGIRAYPRVLPKYRNPSNPLETWAGRGRQPRWVRAQLRSGKRLDDLRIQGV